MPPAPAGPLDLPGLHRAWTSLPAARCDSSFWTALESAAAPLFDENLPLRSEEFFTVQHTGRVAQDEVHFIDRAIVDACNGYRALTDGFSFWNPLRTAAVVGYPLHTVMDQLLLAVEAKMMSMHFVVNCRSCACDVAHYKSVDAIQFVGTFRSTNAFRCPMCTDRTEVRELGDVSVFFQLERLPSIFHRQYYRGFCTDVANKQRLESFFCPAGAGYAFRVQLPEGRYLFSAPFVAGLVELEVEVGADLLGAHERPHVQIIDLKQYTHAARREKNLNAATATRAPRMNGKRNTMMSSIAGGLSGHTWTREGSVGAFGSLETEDAPPVPVIKLPHGRVLFRVYNETEYSGFLDLFISFDRSAEFSALDYPSHVSVPELMHYLPRGLRSPFMKRCIPRPPSTTVTSGVFVQQDFDLTLAGFDDPSAIAVLREVHRYSLEDHHGLLVGVSHGGTSFECTFLSMTAGLASSICFFQRVLTRLGEAVALCLRCSITFGTLKLAAYQGQYDDADNTRSAYPDVQLVGPVVFASRNPPIVAPSLRAYVEEPPFNVDVASSNRLRPYASPQFLGEDDDAQQRLSAAATLESNARGTMVRFELRYTGDIDAGPFATVTGKARTGSEHFDVEDVALTRDEVLPYFLKYLNERFPGTTVVTEPHAVVVLMPLAVLAASVQMATLLDSSAYTREPQEPF